MRLLHAREKTFQEFYEPNIPPYVILSHRWGDQEVSYKEFRNGIAPAGAGLAKINEFCRTAAERMRTEWVWIDTCCIDKRSSAELSEAINSMFRWYEKAKLCLVNLADVNITPEERRLLDKDPPRNESSSERTRKLKARICRSGWFDRGWTLQELIAPECIQFYDASWLYLCDRADLALSIESIPGIERKVLTQKISNLSIYSIAQRMSWVSKRKTLRAEDIAYSLLGLFLSTCPCFTVKVDAKPLFVSSQKY